MLSATTWLWLASAASFLTFGLHTFATRKDIVAPLLDADLHPVSKFTNYYCWHLVTLTLPMMSAAFAISALVPSAWELAAAATLLSALFAFWSIALVIWKKQKAFNLPQWALFIPIAILGLLGLN